MKLPEKRENICPQNVRYTLKTRWHVGKIINNQSDWFWLPFNNSYILLSFSCDLDQSIPPFFTQNLTYTACNIESVLNSNHTQNIYSFVILSLLDLFSLKGQFQISMGGDINISEILKGKGCIIFIGKKCHDG